MKQQTLFQKDSRKPRLKIEFGGELTKGRRRGRRPLDPRKPVHLVLRSNKAKGRRSLLVHYHTIVRVLSRYSRRFEVKIYEKAICGNHIHCLVKARTRKDLQNFLRVFAGQVAQEILRQIPLQKSEEKAFWGGTHPKNQKSFWSELAYTRIVKWGKDFSGVKNYVVDNIKEALGLKKYEPRKTRYSSSA